MGGGGFFGREVWTMNRIARSVSATVLAALLLCTATLTHADVLNPAERYTGVPARADDIGKRPAPRYPRSTSSPKWWPRCKPRRGTAG